MGAFDTHFKGLRCGERRGGRRWQGRARRHTPACTTPCQRKVGGHRRAGVPSCSWRQYECGGVLGVVTVCREGRQIGGGVFICSQVESRLELRLHLRRQSSLYSSKRLTPLPVSKWHARHSGGCAAAPCVRVGGRRRAAGRACTPGRRKVRVAAAPAAARPAAGRVRVRSTRRSTGSSGGASAAVRAGGDAAAARGGGGGGRRCESRGGAAEEKTHCPPRLDEVAPDS